MTEDSSNDSGDIYTDLDGFFSRAADEKYDSLDDAQTGSTSDTWMDDTDELMLPNPTATLTSRMDSERKKMEMDLLLEFVVDGGTSRKTNLKMDPEYQKLLNEVTRLQSLNSQKDEQILELTKENVNLKKNICSLYKTAKSEVEQKDILLTDANKRLDYFEFRKKGVTNLRDKYSQTDNSVIETSEASPRKSKEDAANKQKSNLKDKKASQKRSLSPSQEENELGHKDGTSAKQRRTEKCDSDGKVQSVHQSQNDDQSRSVVQSTESHVESDNSDAASEAEDFDLLPDTVKHCFIEYEISQIESLSRLKQLFVDHYLMHPKNQLQEDSGANAVLELGAKSTKPAKAKFPEMEMSDLGVSTESENEMPFLSPKIQIGNRTSTSNIKENSSNKSNNRDTDCKKARRHWNSNARDFSDIYKYDIVKYYRQRREKMPTLLKRQVFKYHRQTKRT